MIEIESSDSPPNDSNPIPIPTTLFLSPTLFRFTSYELLSYDRFIVLTTLISMLTLERTDLKKRVVLCPEVLSVIRGEQLIYDYLHSFYECDYKTFFGCLVQIDSVIRSEQYLAAHADYYVREMRIKAYVDEHRYNIQCVARNMYTEK